MRECTVCAAANTQLQAQLQQLQQRAEALRTPIQTEGQAIETALRALPQGQQPDATLSQRITAFQTQQQTAQQEIGTRQQQVERNVAFVRQQIGQRIEPAIQQVMQQRGATVVVDAGATLAIAQSVDITPAVLAVVNQNTSPLNVNAPPPQQQAQQPQPQQPQGR
jgi:Skp family chaperone for outer membrane proteins